ncbi:hypothetical protein D7V21_00145 [Acinetobacter guerrae]|uniref:DUF3298 domain-containing protein n=1 Tax=Acinetobacter guerrae TaxID=1843371 RepID=A0A3A8EN56_9GAMM|nr:hypothetical protein [Acinetobacter guerrae]MPW45344.1 hypothetical protein [Acinetobacter guerrae]RKG36045.1 hypothetical protein D7V21_00145 [Acinetobacter guerrae]
MQMTKQFLIFGLIGTLSMLGACTKNKNDPSSEQEKTAISQQKAEVLPYLDIRESKAKYALPFCEKKNCIDIDIQSIQTKDTWLNGWIEQKLAYVVQAQIGQNQKINLQKAINAYIAKSDEWQDQYSRNQAYTLHMTTRVASQRNEYVLLQVGLNSKQEEVTVKDRYYFFVANRKLQKDVNILDILQKNQQSNMNQIVQDNYQKWLKQQSAEVQAEAPTKLYWGQADWFFDSEGIGLHYRANQISKQAGQFDIYLSTAQTKALLQPEIYHKMF